MNAKARASSLLDPVSSRPWIQALLISLGGLLVFVIFWFMYVMVYMGVERVFFTQRPDRMPAGLVRNLSVALSWILYCLVLRSPTSHVIRATLLVGPMAASIAALVLALYLYPVAAALAVGGLTVCAYLLLRYTKSNWMYYFATLIAAGLGIFYAWPRA